MKYFYNQKEAKSTGSYEQNTLLGFPNELLAADELDEPEDDAGADCGLDALSKEIL